MEDIVNESPLLANLPNTLVISLFFKYQNEHNSISYVIKMYLFVDVHSVFLACWLIMVAIVTFVSNDMS